PLHLLEQLVDESLALRLPPVEIAILGLKVGEHIRIIDLRIFRIAQPVPRILDRHAMALVAVGALLCAWRLRSLDGLVHAALLTRRAATGRAKDRRLHATL